MKAILMINEMPKSCKDCILYLDDSRWCFADYEPIDDDKKRPTWCPLIEINDNIAKLIEVAR